MMSSGRYANRAIETFVLFLLMTEKNYRSMFETVNNHVMADSRI
jgi:hypothetical protein